MKFAMIKNNLELRNRYIEDNFNIILWTYNQLDQNKFTISNKEDLINEGVLGFLEAFDHYDESKNIKFITYAVFWIKKYMKMYLNNNSLIRIPEKARKKIKEADNNKFDVASIDDESSYEIKSTFDTEREALSKIEKDEIQSIIRSFLTQSEQRVLALCFGLNNTEEMPVKDIAEIMHTDKFTIYNLRNKSYRKLRVPMEKLRSA